MKEMVFIDLLANPARSGLSADAQGSDCAKGAKDG